jgi:rhamnosyltransferase
LIQLKNKMPTHKLAAIVVSYKPEKNILNDLLELLRPQVDFLILVDNGGAKEYAEQWLENGLKNYYICLEKNLGLGYALNAGFEKAWQLGAEYVGTFDQDSAPPSDMIKKLKEAHEKLTAQNIICAAVGPVFFDRRAEEKIYFPFYADRNGSITTITPGPTSEEIVETDALITSGMLVRTEVWSDGNRYDDGLFVDYTDTEWCYRVRSKGFKLFGCTQVEMGHAPSDAPPARILGFSFFRYSPLRRYYYFRNTIQFCMTSYVSWAWKRRLLTALALRFAVNLLIDVQKISSLKMMARGIYDGFKRKTGEFTQ